MLEGVPLDRAGSKLLLEQGREPLFWEFWRMDPSSNVSRRARELTLASENGTRLSKVLAP